MDWWIIVTIALAVGGIISTVVLTLKLQKNKKPAWAYKTEKIIGLGTDAPAELKLTFGGKTLLEVFRTILIMFNKGRETIRNEDVTEKVSIQFKGADILREPNIKATSKKHNMFAASRAVKQGQDSIELGFLYLDHDDGAVVEVLHTPSEEISCFGNIMGAEEIVNIGEFQEGCPRLIFSRLIILILPPILLLCAALLFEFGLLPSPAGAQLTVRVILWGTSSVALSLLAGILIAVLPRYFRCRKFPSWTRGVLTEKASNLAAKGVSLKAYCVRCRTKKTMKHPQFVTLKGGHPAIRGVCPDCGTKMFRIGHTGSADDDLGTM